LCCWVIGETSGGAPLPGCFSWEVSLVCSCLPGICGRWCVRWNVLIRKNTGPPPGEGVALDSLKGQLGVMVLVTALSSLLCGLVAVPLVGREGVWSSIAAAMVSVPVGVLVIFYFYRYGLSAESIVAGTMIRMFVTTLLAGLVATVFAALRVPAFFLALGVVYLVNLAVETWFALRSKSLFRRMGASARDQ